MANFTLEVDFSIFQNHVKFPAQFSLGGIGFIQPGGGALDIVPLGATPCLRFPDDGISVLFPSVAQVDLEAGEFSGGGQVGAFDSSGGLVAQSLLPNNSIGNLTLTGPSLISRLEFNGGNNEGGIKRILVEVRCPD